MFEVILTVMPQDIEQLNISADIFNMGNPTVIAFGQRDLRKGPGSLPVTESTGENLVQLPWFKRFDRRAIDKYASAYRKVAEAADELRS